jgi:ADP-ribosylation factor GTPase-activating protein 1
MCLSCAGIHRGLGVHISFVRSVSMDAFKQGEILRMQQGGNNTWKDFFNEHETTKMQGVTWDECTIADRYSGPVGEEYKERLTAKIEGREYVPGEKSKDESAASASSARNSKPSSLVGSRSGTPIGSRDKKTTSALAGSTSSLRSSSPASSLGTSSIQNPSRKQQNETYFARLGAENENRPADLPPNQGGKFTGFGGGYEPPQQSNRSDGAALPGVDEFTKDPVAALTKGFGWFTTTVGKGAKQVNDGWIQPTAAKVCPALTVIVHFHTHIHRISHANYQTQNT